MRQLDNVALFIEGGDDPNWLNCLNYTELIPDPKQILTRFVYFAALYSSRTTTLLTNRSVYVHAIGGDIYRISAQSCDIDFLFDSANKQACAFQQTKCELILFNEIFQFYS